MQQLLSVEVTKAVKELYGVDLENIEFQSTRKEFEGDITVVVFSMLRHIKGNPVQIGENIGNYLKSNVKEVAGFNMVKGFLNIVIDTNYYLDFFNTNKAVSDFGFVTPDEKQGVMVEYSSPNTNKPLHLGHVRNNLLGYAVSNVLEASGKKVYKTQIINDRGIHICKSMLAWQKFGEGETPDSTGLKGDKLVGNYYVKFDQVYKEEIKALVASGITEEEAKKKAPLMIEAQEMLRKWEQGDDEVVRVWKMMNQWVYDGFGVTYNKLGVSFDKNYYESDTYKLGRSVIEEGLEKGIFYRKDDGSVWIDLTDEGLDEKLVLRSDGTAVYMTQDIGTAIQRSKDFFVKGMVYTVGNEQDYHFKVLFLILKKLGYTWADNLFHLSYGMVNLPNGRMKSREGTVVDADDLIDEMKTTAENISEELGKLDGYSEEQKQEVYRKIGLGALKYFMLKVDPKKSMIFNPEESIDFQGNTGPFIQYTYARIQAIKRKSQHDQSVLIDTISMHEKEKELIKQLAQYPNIIQLAAKNYSPAVVANYIYDLVKAYNSFFQNVSIFGADTEVETLFRAQLSEWVGNVIASGFGILGIDVPERM